MASARNDKQPFFQILLSKQLATSNVSSHDTAKNSFHMAISQLLILFSSQPFHVIMRLQQGALALEPPRVLSVPAAYQEIMSGQSWPVLFRGLSGAIVKELLKNLWKAYFISNAPLLAEDLLSEEFRAQLSPGQHYFLRSALAAVIASIPEATVGNTLDAYATFRATSQGKHINANYIQFLKSAPTAWERVMLANRGMTASFFKANATFFTFFTTAQPIKMAVEKRFDVQPGTKAPWMAALISAVLSGGITALATSFLDIIRTHIHMAGATPGKSTVEALRSNWALHGMKGITPGVPIKIAQNVAIWTARHLITQQVTAQEPEKRVVLGPRQGG
jgi:hypothetical protein